MIEAESETEVKSEPELEGKEETETEDISAPEIEAETEAEPEAEVETEPAEELEITPVEEPSVVVEEANATSDSKKPKKERPAKAAKEEDPFKLQPKEEKKLKDKVNNVSLILLLLAFAIPVSILAYILIAYFLM